MMGGMLNGMFWGFLLVTIFFLGFAYVIWVMAEKEKNGLKTVGQGIAIVMAILAAIMLLYGGIYGGVMGRGGFGRKAGVWGPRSMRHMMLIPQHKREAYMEEMMKSPQIRQWVEEYLEKCEIDNIEECEEKQ
jgi:amino acid transporter